MKLEKVELKNSFLEYIKVIIITVLVTYSVLYFVQVSRVVGSSMEPTYQNGNIILVDKFFYKRSEPEVNDIVVVEYPVSDNENQIIKRVVGIGGDHIEVKDNHLYRNGEMIEEDYILETMDTEDFSYDIPEGKIFVLGDNRNISVDSRMIGYVDFEDDVIGKVFFKVF
ncbi:MAG: signal peptidase I [Bacilli bacterium]|nr:signal peptidase I [Bacilli bacterium]